MRRKVLVGILLVYLVFLFGGLCDAQPVEEWNKTFGGLRGDQAYSVQQTMDGGYIIIGECVRTYIIDDFTWTNNSFWLIKTDPKGNEEWNKTFNNSCCDRCFSGQQTADGGYILAGFTKSAGTGYDFWLVKTDSKGNEEWNKIFGGIGGDYGYSVQQTTDGGYIIAGKTHSYGAGFDDVGLIKTDSNGNMEWDRTFGGSFSDRGDSVQQTSDGGYIIAGRTSSYGAGGEDVWLIKTNSNGNMEWSRTFGDSGNDWGRSVQQTSDGGYIITCWTYGVVSYDVGLIKTDSDGNEEWGKSFGGADMDVGYSVQQTSDGGYISAGATWSYGVGGDVWLIKTDSNGNEEWNKTYGGSSADGGRAVQQTSDGGYIIAGETYSYGAGESDVWLLKVKGRKVSEIPTPTPAPRETPIPPVPLSPTPTATPIRMPITTPSPTAPELKETPVPIEPTPTPEIPAFEVIFSVPGLLAVAYLLSRRR